MTISKVAKLMQVNIPLCIRRQMGISKMNNEKILMRCFFLDNLKNIW